MDSLFEMTDGKLTLLEGKSKENFYVYRNDGKSLEKEDMDEAIELFNAYIMHKMIYGEITDQMVIKNVFQEISEDETVIKLTIDDIKKKPNFIKRMLIKILG